MYNQTVSRLPTGAEAGGGLRLWFPTTHAIWARGGNAHGSRVPDLVKALRVPNIWSKRSTPCGVRRAIGGAKMHWYVPF